jgi:hypothetical protein
MLVALKYNAGCREHGMTIQPNALCSEYNLDTKFSAVGKPSV